MANGIVTASGLAALMLAAGCVSTSQVVLVGNGRYMITGQDTGEYNAGRDTLQPAKIAKAYCAKQSKKMVIVEIEKVSLTFTCQ
jgi:hypothetical protein